MFPTNDPKEWLAHLLSIGAVVPGCKSCDEQIKYLLEHNRMMFAPSHKTRCDNKYDHCTCDRCF